MKNRIYLTTRRVLAAAIHTLIATAAGVHAAQDIDYSLTALTDPVQPGDVIVFEATVRNLSAATQNVNLQFTVPEFTIYDYYNLNSPGTNQSFNFGALQPGQTKTAQLHFTIKNSGTVAPDGTSITLTLHDQPRAVELSRSVTVRYSATLTLALSTQQATVAPGTQFTYTLTSANVTTSSLSGVALSATVPAGATFVSADNGGALNGSTVQWNLGTMEGAANRQVHVTFAVNNDASTTLGPVEATLTDTAGDTARASDTRALYSAPSIQYILTTNPDSVQPGHVIEFELTARNLTAASQNVRLDFTVPEFTVFEYYNLNSGGTSNDVAFSLGAAETKTARLHFTVVNSGSTAPNGSTINVKLVDEARGASISRSVVVRYAQSLTLALSSQQASVAPGSQFTYTLASANVTPGDLAGVTLTAAVPPGATFVSADAGGTLNGGVVQWSLGTLAAGANQQVRVTFQAPGGAGALLGSLDAVLSNDNGDVARASDTRVLNSAPDVQYTLTASPDPVSPGHVVEFDLTARNLTAASQQIRLDFIVPDFTYYDYYALYSGGSSNDVAFALDPGETKTARLHFTLVGSDSAAPNGTTINLNLIDGARGMSISRNVVVRYAQTLTLALASEQGTVAPGGQFTYTVAAANVNSTSLSGVILNVTVPPGVSFVSADGGGTLDGGVVKWSFGTLAAGANEQVHVVFAANSGATTTLGPVEAILVDNSGDIARASDTRVLYSAPDIEYTLVPTANSIEPGHVAEFDLTVHNLTAASQSVRLDFTVPDSTFYDNYSGYGGGSTNDVAFSLSAGESKTAQLHFTVDGTDDAPPNGTTLRLNLIDAARGASISRIVVVRAVVPETPATPHYANISTRMNVGTGDSGLIGGFIVTGSGSKRILLRAIGPSLPIEGSLADPVLTLYDSSQHPIASNDNWQDNADKQAIIDTGIPPKNDAEAALLISVPPGAYTAIVTGANGGTGVGLVEVYDLNEASDAELANISTRGAVSTGDAVMIGGIIIRGDVPTKIVVRAIGPSLPVTGALADPVLELRTIHGDLVYSNDNWRDAQEADIVATGIPPANDAESAIVATLDPGLYTAIVRGSNEATGIALVEAYDLQ